MTRKAAKLISGLMIALLLAGCGPSEPERRQAFIAFLQSEVLPRTDPGLPMLDQLTRDRIGDYAKDYAVITRFQAVMNLSVVGPLREVATAGAPRTTEEVGALRGRLSEMITTLAEAEKRANEKRAALGRSGDLARIYGLAFDKLVTRPAADFRREIASALAGLPRGAAR